MSTSSEEVVVNIVSKENSNQYEIRSYQKPSSEPRFGVTLASQTQNDIGLIPLKRDEIVNITSRAQDYLNQSENQAQQLQLNRLLDNLIVLVKRQIDLPKIEVHLAQDNSSIALSWKVGKTAVFGANISVNTDDSSWFLIQGGVRGYQSDGYLNDPDFDIQLPSIFSLLMSFRNK